MRANHLVPRQPYMVPDAQPARIQAEKHLGRLKAMRSSEATVTPLVLLLWGRTASEMLHTTSLLHAWRRGAFCSASARKDRSSAHGHVSASHARQRTDIGVHLRA